MMRIEVRLVDSDGEPGSNLVENNIYIVVGIDSSFGFYVIDDSGKIYKTSSSIDNGNVWELISVFYGGEGTIYAKPQVVAAPAPADAAPTIAVDRAEPTDPGLKE